MGDTRERRKREGERTKNPRSPPPSLRTSKREASHENSHRFHRARVSRCVEPPVRGLWRLDSRRNMSEFSVSRRLGSARLPFRPCQNPNSRPVDDFSHDSTREAPGVKLGVKMRDTSLLSLVSRLSLHCRHGQSNECCHNKQVSIAPTSGPTIPASYRRDEKA